MYISNLLAVSVALISAQRQGISFVHKYIFFQLKHIFIIMSNTDTLSASGQISFLVCE